MKLQQVHSLLIYSALAFIAMAGLAYINFLPAVVNALAGGVGFSQVEAGQVVALNGYGSILGMVIAIFLVPRIQWRPITLLLLAILSMVDLASSWVETYSSMLIWRFLAGCLGGLCVGIAFSVLARLSNPDRAFGLLLSLQFVTGSLVIYSLPELETLFGVHAVFIVMTSILWLSVVFLLLLPDSEMSQGSHSMAMSVSKLAGRPLALLLAMAFYQCAASGIWAYVGLIGFNANIEAGDVSAFVAMTGLLGLPGAMVPVISGNRFGRLRWVTAGVILSLVSSVLLSLLQPGTLAVFMFYIMPMAALFFCWPAVQSYLLAITADMDSSGQLSTVAALVSYLGLASGPLLAASLLEENSFTTMLYACALIFLLSLVLLFKPVRVQENKR